jgi:hypothetical protein
MTAAMLVLEPIFEADLPPEIYACRSWAQRPAGRRKGRVAAVPWPSGPALRPRITCRPRDEVAKLLAGNLARFADQVAAADVAAEPRQAARLDLDQENKARLLCSMTSRRLVPGNPP